MGVLVRSGLVWKSLLDGGVFWSFKWISLALWFGVFRGGLNYLEILGVGCFWGDFSSLGFFWIWGLVVVEKKVEVCWWDYGKGFEGFLMGVLV